LLSDGAQFARINVVLSASTEDHEAVIKGQFTFVCVCVPVLAYPDCRGILAMKQMKGSERTEHIDIFLFSARHSVVFYFRSSVYWWKGSVSF